MKKMQYFTLLELCLVLIVSALMSAMLVGAIGKRQAETIQCADNMRRLAQAITAYGNDSDGYFFNEYGNLVDNYAYAGYARYTGYVGGPSYAKLATDPALRVHSNTPKVFICPSLEITSDKLGRFTYPMSYNGRGEPYYAAAKVFNGELKDNKGKIYALSEVFVAADGISHNYENAADCNRLSNSGYNANFSFPQGRHEGDTANFMFLDGHVETKKPAELSGKSNFLTNAKVQSFWIYFIEDKRFGN